MKNFYTSKEYRTKQSLLTKRNWQKGIFAFLLKKEKRVCRREGCGSSFEVLPSDPKIYCSMNCSATVNNKNRTLSVGVRMKIAKSMTGKISPFKGVLKVPRIKTKCHNSLCDKVFFRERWRDRKYCSAACAIHVVGSQPTSPKAARAKAGIRADIGDKIYFYSRWEANVARLFTSLLTFTQLVRIYARPHGRLDG